VFFNGLLATKKSLFLHVVVQIDPFQFDWNIAPTQIFSTALIAFSARKIRLNGAFCGLFWWKVLVRFIWSWVKQLFILFPFPTPAYWAHSKSPSLALTFVLLFAVARESASIEAAREGLLLLVVHLNDTVLNFFLNGIAARFLLLLTGASARLTLVTTVVIAVAETAHKLAPDSPIQTATSLWQIGVERQAYDLFASAFGINPELGLFEIRMKVSTRTYPCPWFLKSIHSPSYAAVVQHLRKLRVDAGMTQQAVAEKLGRPQSFVAKIESGERRLDIFEFAAFCTALGHSSVVPKKKSLVRFVQLNLYRSESADSAPSLHRLPSPARAPHQTWMQHTQFRRLSVRCGWRHFEPRFVER
jgi:transcriptional regulator with XRE-family HTH domain